MSKNKIRHTEHVSKSFPVIKTLSGILLTGGMIWGLVSLFQPSGNLVPYNKYKKTEVSAAAPEDTAPKSQPESAPPASDPEPVEQVALNDPDKNALDFTKVVSDPTVPQTKPPIDLPRETLEYISRGMDLAEKGKYERAELEFEKAADLSPNSPEVFSIWGAALRMQKKFKGANKRFAKAYELAPNDEEIAFNAGTHTEVMKLAFEDFQRLAQPKILKFSEHL